MPGIVRAKVSSKGQITLPKAVREALGLEESSVVEFELTDGGALLTPARSSFLDRYGSITPRTKPENWSRVRAATAKQVGRRAAEPGR